MTKKQREPRVLVGVTTYWKKDYIFHRCMAHIAAFNYSNFDVVVVDNSPDLNYFYKLKRKYKNVFHTPRGENSRVALTRAQNKIRDIVLENDYDYLLFVESDLLPPADSITRLLGFGKAVVGSTYIIGTGDVKVPCIFVDDFTRDGLKSTRPIGIKEDEFGRRYHVPQEVDSFLNRGLQPCHGCGFGLTLISRDVVERFPFWCDIRLDNKHSDVYFYLDLARNFIQPYIDTDRIIPHFPIPWESVKDK